MKNITFSAKEEAIEKARITARKKQRTLNDLFREWLDSVSFQDRDEDSSIKLKSLWSQTNYLRVGKKLTRDEMNER